MKKLHKNTKPLKEKLNRFFREMRKKGYTAKQNFWCCQNCAWNALSDKECEKVVFYHKQDNYNLNKNGSLCIAWNGDAKLIKSTAEECCINVEWTGEENQRMKFS